MASLKVPSFIRIAKTFHDGSLRFCNLSVISSNVRGNIARRDYSTEEVRPNEAARADHVSDADAKCRQELEALNKDLQTYKERNAELEDKYKRALADGENLRRRMSKQLEEAKVFSIQAFCKDLLAVADTLSIATNSVSKDQISEKNPHLKSLLDGLTLTEAQLTQVFRRHGLEQVNPLKEKFNPNLHEALFVQEVEGAVAGTVVVVSKVGYKLQERCVRPALVGVAK